MLMAGCIIPHTPIAVDYWKRWDVRSKICFLSHMHTDHTQGLSSSWNQPIFCSEITRSLAIEQLKIQPSLLVAIPVGESTIIPLDNEGVEKMTVTLIDANHCAGAVMFLFQGYFGCILHTGDFRYFDGMLDIPLFTSDIVINTLYLDNTYCDPKCEFPTKSEAKEKILEIIHNNPEQDIRFGLDILGKENLLCDIAKDQGVPIFVDEFRYKTTKLLGCSEYFTLNVEETFIRAERKNAVNKSTLAHLNKFFPTIGVIPSALYQGRNNPFAKSETIFVVPYSDHSSFSELKTFVGKLKPQRIVPIVGKKNKDEDTHDRADMSIFAAEMSSDAGHHVFDVPQTVQAFISRSFQANVNCRGKKRKASNSYFNGRPKKACGINFSPKKQNEVCTDKTSTSKSLQENEIDTNETSLTNGRGENDELPTDSANEASEETMNPPIKAGRENNTLNETPPSCKKSAPVVDTTLPGAMQSSSDKNPSKGLCINRQRQKALNTNITNNKVLDNEFVTAVGTTLLGIAQGTSEATSEEDCSNSRKDEAVAVIQPTLPGSAKSNSDENCLENRSTSGKGKAAMPIKRISSKDKDNNQDDQTQMFIDELIADIEPTFPGAAQSTVGENFKQGHSKSNQERKTLLAKQIRTQGQGDNLAQKSLENPFTVTGTTLPNVARSSSEQETSENRNKSIQDSTAPLIEQKRTLVKNDNQDKQMQKFFCKSNAEADTTLPRVTQNSSQRTSTDNRTESSNERNTLPSEIATGKVKDYQDDQTHKSATVEGRVLLSSAHRNVEETPQSSAREKLSTKPKLQCDDHDIEMHISSQKSVVETVGTTFLPKPEARGIQRADSQNDKNVEVSPADSTRVRVKEQESGYCECLPNVIATNVYEKQNDSGWEDTQTFQETKENVGAQIFDDKRNQEENQIPKLVEICENDQKKSYEVIIAPQPRLLSKTLSVETEFENSVDPHKKDAEESDEQINSGTVTSSQGVSQLQNEEEVCLNIFNDTETFVRIEVDECSVQFLDMRSVPESVEKQNDTSDREACSTSKRGVDERRKSNPITEQGGEDKAQTTNDQILNTSELGNQKLPKLFNPLQEPLSCSDDDTQIAAVIVPQCPEFSHTVIKSDKTQRKEEHPDVFNRAVKSVTNSSQKLGKYKLYKCDLRIVLDDPAQLARQIRRNSDTHRMEGDLVNVDTLAPTSQQKSSESEICLCQSGDKSPKQEKRAEPPACSDGGERPDVHIKISTSPKRSPYNGHFVHPRRVKRTQLKIDEKADTVLTIDRKMQEPQAKSEKMLGEIQVPQCHHPEIDPKTRVSENVDCSQNEVSSTTETGTCQFCGCNVETPQVLLNKRDGIHKQSSLLGCDHQLQQLRQMVFLGKPMDENADKLQNNPDESSRESEHRDAINCQAVLRTNRRTLRAIYTGDVSFARAVLEKWVKENVKDGEDQSA